MTDIGPDGLPLGRSTLTLVVASLGGLVLAASALWFCYASYAIYTGGNDATCTNEKPDRHVGTIIVVSAVIYCAMVTPAIFLLRKKELEWAFFGLVLAFFALLEPCGGLGWILFSIGMC
jgi:hypothetical protein